MRRLAETLPLSQIPVRVNGSISANRSADALWAAVARLVGAEYDLAGELSASADGRRAAYIATRRTPGGELALLVVERGAAPDAYELSFHEVLDESVPARELYCPHCSSHLETWAATCPACGRNTALATAIQRGQVSDLSLRSAVVSALGADSTALGQLPTASGSVAVFARSARTGEIVALALERIGGGSGPVRAIPVARLVRHESTGEAPAAAPAEAPAEAPKRPSSPHSGELGPLAEPDRSLMTTVPAGPPVLSRVCPRCGKRYVSDMRYCSVDGAELRELGVHDDLVGKVVGGKFRVEKLLGQGGMGRVYLAEHTRIGRRCALKVLAPHLVGDPRSIRRFDGEARNASRIVHPSVAVVYDFEETPDGLVYLVLEYVDGETLSALMGRSEDQRIDVTRAMRIAREVADALQAAHDLGIVHRDLKPDNIMLTQRDRVKVVDFGIAKAIEGGESQQGMTRTGFIVGTPRYMSPEQLGGTTVDARTDIFALGCVLYEMVTGRAAYDAPITSERTARTQSRFRQGAPGELDAIITKAMARSADERYQTAAEMRDALDALLSGGRPDARRAWLMRIGIGAVVIAAAAVAAVMFTGRRPAHPTAVSPPPPVTVADSPSVPTPVPSAPETPAVATNSSPPPAVASKPSVSRPAPVSTASHTPSAPPSTQAPVLTATTPSPTPAPVPVPAESATSDEVGRPMQYLLHVKQVIRDAWVDALDGYRPNGGERAEYVLMLDDTGQVVDVRPVSMSNQAAYDDPLDISLHKLSTFGPPPPRVSRELRVLFRGAELTVQAGNLSTPVSPR